MRFLSLLSFLSWTLFGAFLGLSSCDSPSEQSYARHRAFLRFQPVATAPSLLQAVSHAGHWCSIEYDAQHYLLAAPGTPLLRRPLTALVAYGAPRSIAGFIVGTPQLPDVQGQNVLRAYDLACPSCYESTLLVRSLRLLPVGTDAAQCPECGRRYNLSTAGLLSAPNDGQKNVLLYRYRCHYAPPQGLLVVQN